jgi:hypothetical protein
MGVWVGRGTVTGLQDPWVVLLPSLPYVEVTAHKEGRWMGGSVLSLLVHVILQCAAFCHLHCFFLATRCAIVTYLGGCHRLLHGMLPSLPIYQAPLAMYAQQAAAAALAAGAGAHPAAPGAGARILGEKAPVAHLLA